MSSSHGFKAQLKEALSDAVSRFQDSGDPNAACIKAANAAGFNADQADRLVETFNTARVICHYKAAEDKASGCSLADKATVRGGLAARASEEKDAEYSTVDYGCYKEAEVDYVVPQVKMAEFVLREEPISKEAEDWLRLREEETVRELVKSAEEEARAANAMADELAMKVAAHLSRNVSIDDVHDRVARMVAAYALDDRYAPGVEKVAEFLPEASDPDLSLLRKYASRHVVDTDGLEEVMAAVKEAADFVAEASALEAYAADMRKEAQEAGDDDLKNKGKPELEEMLLRERIVGERRRNASPVVAKAPAAPKGGGGSKGGGGGIGVGKDFLFTITDIARDQAKAEAQSRINKATDGVNNLRRQLILQDLLARDKVLSQEDPNSVVAAYRSVHQVSPDTTLNKEVLRSMLRSAVQSVAISPYDAKTLADVDKARHQAYGERETTGGRKDD